MTKSKVKWTCPHPKCNHSHKWSWDEWDIYPDSKIGMTCDKCGKTTDMEMKVNKKGNATASVPDVVPVHKDKWRTIFADLMNDNGCYEICEVNVHQLASHLEELYLKIDELETQISRIMNQREALNE